jgi:asparagine synthase (glutamine-hydrolysing)
MCGFAGLILSPRGAVDASVLEEVLRRLAHRGPDDSGWLEWGPRGLRGGRELAASGATDAELVLLHRRLSILDLSSAGRQPMTTPDGRLSIVFNGEIYNFVELRAELERLGERFHSGCDTEVLLAAFARWGRGALERLVGMFAFAVLDTGTRTVFLARDPFGIKPLYYTRWAHGLAFASQIGALLALPGVDRAACAQRVYDYLRFGITDNGGETFFAGIRQLPAGHLLELPLDGRREPEPEPEPYWRPRVDSTLELSFAEAAERVRELFLESVRLHLRSDVPVGAALSGGIDSSSIALVMRELAGPGLELHAFSYLSDDPPLSEERWIRIASRAAAATTHTVTPTLADLPAGLDEAIEAHEEPFESTTMCVQLRVARLAREAGIKVVLNGQGADELLGGYSIALTARLASLVRQGRWLEAGRFLRRLRDLPQDRSLRGLARAEGLVVPSALRPLARKLLAGPLVPPWLDSAWAERNGVVAKSPWAASGRHVLRERLILDVTETKLPMLLRYEDRNWMAHSIECRVPFVTPQLGSFLLSLPESYLVAPDGTRKAVFRAAMRGLVPDEILDRKDKIGFLTPERLWLLELREWVDGIYRSDAATRVSAIDVPALRADWERAARAGPAAVDARFWRCLSLIRWADLFDVSFDRPGDQRSRLSA